MPLVAIRSAIFSAARGFPAPKKASKVASIESGAGAAAASAMAATMKRRMITPLLYVPLPADRSVAFGESLQHVAKRFVDVFQVIDGPRGGGDDLARDRSVVRGDVGARA